MSDRLWYTQIQFTAPRPISFFRSKRDLPDVPGCYVFTETAHQLVPGQVLYVGRALSLRERVWGYLADWSKLRPTTHKGRAFIYEFRHKHADEMYLRWAVYGDPNTLEASLIDYLNPDYNSRDEANPFADDEGLDASYLP